MALNDAASNPAGPSAPVLITSRRNDTLQGSHANKWRRRFNRTKTRRKRDRNSSINLSHKSGTDRTESRGEDFEN